MSANDSLLEVYIFENLQLLEQLEGLLLAGEKNGHFSPEQIDAIFRILHTIKGSSAMMNYDNLTKISHCMEDLFAFIRENKSQAVDHRKICDFIFSAEDYIRNEMEKLQDGNQPDGNPGQLLTDISDYFQKLKNNGQIEPSTEKAIASVPIPSAASHEVHTICGKVIKAKVFFQEDCKMENVRAFGIIKSIEDMCYKTTTIPEDVLCDHSDDEIIAHGFTLFMDTIQDVETIKKKILQSFFIRSLEVEEMMGPQEELLAYFYKKPVPLNTEKQSSTSSAADVSPAHKQNYMSVKLEKLDKLMDLVGELVITEGTVTKNPEVLDLHLDSFEKASRQLRKLTDELQDTVMSIRMIPISATFHKLERIVRDMSKKEGKNAELIISGEDTEMDKNVIDNLSDPLMHIIRNSMDHGIESAEERIQKGKRPAGRITLDARNTGGDILITETDDGHGLNREILIKKGIEKGLIKKPESEVTDREAFSLIFMAGFSTKDQVTEYSGRGVGMDVAMRNIEKMGGSLTIDSTPNNGVTVQIRIPLTLAIITGMQVAVGSSVYIIPLLSIKESFKPKQHEVFTDPEGNEMIYIRDHVYPVFRLNRLFKMDNGVNRFEDGILVLVEGDLLTYCLFVDSLIGEQQTVIKPIPPYISHTKGWIKGIAGCTILGDGSISLILDINGLVN